MSLLTIASPASRPRRALAAGLALVLVLPVALRAVIVSPTAVFLGDRERSTQVTLFNNTATAEEITLELKYGYPDTDSTGNVVYRLIDTPAAGDPSAAGFMTMYPRRMTLTPGARQVVRLVASPPADLPDGEYWARFVVRSNPQPIVEATGADPGVRAGLQLEMRTVIPVLFRKGDVSTGVTIRGLAARAVADSVIANAEIVRAGNAAFLGNMLVELRDAQGSVRYSHRSSIAVHVDQKRRFALPLPSAASLAAGGLELQVTLTTDRGDLPSSRILRTAPVTASAKVTTS